MEIIVTHLSSDFDSFAGMVAAKKLYPKAQIVLPNSINQNVRKFIALHEDSLPILKDCKEINFKKVKKMIVIDTKISSRLGRVEDILKEKNIEVFIYDHHQKSSEDIKNAYEYTMDVGATTTILINILKKKKIIISPLEATLFVLGIYEDTGSFTYPSTTYKDLDVAAYLLERGANLFLVSKFLSLSITKEQHELLEKLIMNCKKIKINEKDIIFSHAKVNSYIEGLSVLTRKLSQIEDVNIVFNWVKMKEKTYVVSRSDDVGVDISKILAVVGGGGHPQAASAVVKDLSFKEIENKIIHSLKENIKKPLTAKDIMSYPVRVINEDEKIIKVSNVLKKYGHSGIPIVNSKGSLAGIITRKDVDKAINHGLGHAPVKGFKSSGIITTGPNTTIDEIQRMMIENGIGRIPIIKEKGIVGIVTRKDILRFLHGQRFYMIPQKDFIYYTSEIKEKITSLFTEEINDILKNISMAAKELKINAYLVGGIVRDILLGMPNFDIDIVIEGDGIGFAKKLSKKLGCRMNSHKKFNTAVLVLGDGQHIDIATSRIEFYKKPGALPSVEWGSIRQDLARRDFTINSMALSLNEKNFGQILDFFGGRKDLNDKRVKILHKMSFIEDPTRIFRAVRFEQRLGFEMDKQTEKLVRAAIEMDVVPEFAGVRIRDELISILNEEKPWKPIKRLYELEALKKVGLDTKINLNFVNQIKNALKYYEKLIDFSRNDIKKWRIIIILLLIDCKIDYIKKWCFKMKIKKRDINIIVDTIENFKSAEDSLKKIIHKNFNLYRIVSRLPKELMVILSSQNGSCYKNIKKYLCELAGIKLSINGNTIKDLGFKPSKNYKIVLDRLFELKLEGKIKSKDEEIHMAKLLMDKVEKCY